MAVSVTYPGVYVQEIPSAVRTIVGVPTSVAAFVGAAERGPLDTATQVDSWSAYARAFGGVDNAYPMSWAVYLYFANGGATAQVVRAGGGGRAANVDLGNDYKLEAASPGTWGGGLRVEVDDDELIRGGFNLTVTEVVNGVDASREQFRALNKDTVAAALARSALVRLSEGAKPTKEPTKAKKPAAADGQGGNDGGGGAAAEGQLTGGAAPKLDWDAVGGDAAKQAGRGIYALGTVDIFNMLCLPTAPDATWANAELDLALAFCQQQRAVLIVDPPTAWDKADLTFQDIRSDAPVDGSGTTATYAAVYYPNLLVTGTDGQPHKVGPSGAVAGVWAATDASRGVWKAPAGTAASVLGVNGFSAFVDDAKSGVLNRQAVNALRAKPLYGPVVWGARTAAGADENASEWKYLPVRRTALYIEESLRRATQWAVFEPNDEPLWSSLRLNVGVFMHSTWRAGAFQGTTPAEAYFVKCDKDVNPQAQVDLGIVNIVVGFAPLKPAEFVVISIQQMAGQLET